MMHKLLPAFLALIFLARTGAASDRTDRVDALHEKAYTYLDTNYDSAFLLAEQARQLAGDEGDAYREAQSLFIQSYIYRMQDEMGKSFVLNLEALELLKDEISPRALKTKVRLLSNTAEIMRQHYAYNEAIRYYDEAILVAQSPEMNDHLPRLYLSKSRTLRLSEKFPEALEYIAKGEQLARDQNDETLILDAINSRGFTLIEKGDYKLAREAFQELISFPFEKENEAVYRGRAWHNIGYSYHSEKKFLEAIKAYQQALDWRYKEDSNEKLFLTYKDLGETNFELDNYRQADSLLQIAEAFYPDVIGTPENYDLFDLRTQVALKFSRTEEASKYHNRYYKENEQFLKVRQEILEVKDRYKMEVLTAGFFAQRDAERREAQWQMYLRWGIHLLIAIVIVAELRFLYIRRSIEKAINDIQKNRPI